MDKIKEMEASFYKEYKKLGGEKDFDTFEYYYSVFFAITFACYTGGFCPFESREEAFNKWVKFIGSKKEANLIFMAVNNIAPYS